MVRDRKTERLRSIMAAYEGRQHSVVAFGVQQGKAHFISAGISGLAVPPEDLIFEIGSITKVFTGILLCLLVEEGKVDPKAPLREMSDVLRDVPDWITAERLSAHTSGLPRLHVPLWRGLIRPLPGDPYAAFTRADLLTWLQAWRGTSPGDKLRHAYSNLGVGLLGEAMALQTGKPFVDLLAERVLQPLGLTDTGSVLSEDQHARFAQPKNTRGKPVTPWTFQALAAAGCLRSSARDMARFSTLVLRAMTAPETVLDRAIGRSAQPVFGLGPKGGMAPGAQCSGWLSMTLDRHAPRFLYHDGGTAGSTCALCVCPERAEACAVLSNNGIAANLWTSAKLEWSNPLRQVHDYFMEDGPRD